MTRVSRRRFAANAAALASAAVLPASAAPATPATSDEVEARLANIVRQYGSRLSPDQLKHLRKILADNERMLAPVRSFPIENGDTPASVLKIRPE